MKQFIFLLCMFLCCNTVAAQKHKKWFDNYWLSVNTSLLKGASSDYSSIAGFAAVGRYIKKDILAGAGVGYVNFKDNNNAVMVYGSFEKDIVGKKRSLFFYAQPGLSFANKPIKQLEGIDGNEYNTSKPGFAAQAGAGIKWMVGRHNFFISTGILKTTYSIHTTEYPVPVDPYNPFVEEPIAHEFRFKFVKLSFNMGFMF